MNINPSIASVFVQVCFIFPRAATTTQILNWNDLLSKFIGLFHTVPASLIALYEVVLIIGSSRSITCFLPRRSEHGERHKRTVWKANISDGSCGGRPSMKPTSIPWVAHNVCIEYVAAPSETKKQSAVWCFPNDEMGPSEKKRPVSVGSTLRNATQRPFVVTQRRNDGEQVAVQTA